MKELPLLKKSHVTGKTLEVFNINREDPHATLISFPDEKSALEAIKANSPNYISLDGTGNSTGSNHLISDLSGSLRMIMIPATGKILKSLQTGR